MHLYTLVTYNWKAKLKEEMGEKKLSMMLTSFSELSHPLKRRKRGSFVNTYILTTPDCEMPLGKGAQPCRKGLQVILIASR